MIIPMKTLLITLYYADGLHGGVKYSVELGQYMQTIGYAVQCVGIITNDKTIEYFAKHGIKLINFNNFNCEQKFDLVWAHHFPILPILIRRGLKYEKVINSCISNILLIERPIFFHKNINMILTLTEKTKNMFIRDYGIDENKIHILPNTAPDIFFENARIKSLPLRSVAVISNHCPPEVINALKILKQHNITSKIYGGKNSVDITPNIMAKHDVIISIGKTVQYALAMKIPIYNYDHFGGSGYITPENIDIEQSANFSGRTFFTKKSAQTIANEIMSQYEYVSSQTDILYKIALQRFKQSVKIQEVLNLLESGPIIQPVAETTQNRLLFDYCEYILQSAKPVPETKFKRLWRHIKSGKF